MDCFVMKIYTCHSNQSGIKTGKNTSFYKKVFSDEETFCSEIEKYITKYVRNNIQNTGNEITF